MKVRKIIAIVLAVITVSGAAVACSGSGGSGTGTGGDGPKNRWGGVPDGTTFDGEEFVISTYHDGNIGHGWTNYFDVDEPEEGNLMENAANRRNLRIEADLKCTITCTEDFYWFGNGEGLQYMENKVLNGEDDVDLYFLESYHNFATLVIDQVLYDAATLPYITWDADYYNREANDLYELGGKKYIFVSDMTYPCQSAGCLVLNREKLVDIGYENNYVYDLVDKKEWYFDDVFRLIEGQTEDLDRDGDMDDNDYYGFAGNPYGACFFFPGAGLKGVYLGNDGFEFDYGTLRARAVIDKIETFVRKPEVWVKEWNMHDHMLFAGHCLFSAWGSEIRMFNELNFEFGIIPFPMFDDTQDTYYNYASGGYLLVPSNITRPEFVGAMIEAMSLGSQQELLPAFYENFIQQRVIQDEPSRRNWERMLTEWSFRAFTSVFSPNDYVSYYAPAFKKIDQMSTGGVNDYSSYWAAIEELVTEDCDAFYAKFMSKI
ncbi:MAG: hypothetical protein J5830_00485 [Clostridia bacterium]|nr:hypothetical protein [Clostridia bacterium]